MPGAAQFLFVYGTLRGEFRHPMHARLARLTRYVCRAHMHGLLFDIGSYPAAIAAAASINAVVHGELYKITNSKALWERLDAYEECSDHFPHPHEYARTIVTVYSSPNEPTQSWAYLYARDTSGLKPIPGGDYLEYLRQRRCGGQKLARHILAYT